MYWQEGQKYFRTRRLSAVALAICTLCPNVGLAQQNKLNNIAVASPTFNRMTPIADKTKPAEATKTHTGVKENPKESPKEPAKDEYPTLGRMESITFGHANSGLSLDTRLNYLEATIFRQSFSQLSPVQRAAQLQMTLFGAVEDTHFPGSPLPKPQHPAKAIQAAPTQTQIEPQPKENYQAEHNAVQTEGAAEQTQEAEGHQAESQPFYQAQISPDELKIFVLQMINDRRQLQGLPTLAIDEIAAKVAQSHAQDLAQRNTLSHFNAEGENPDQRYTKAGGSDSMSECLTMISDHGKLNRLVGMYFLRDLLKRQDDRDSIMSPDATGLGFAVAENHNHSRAYGCFELVSKHGLLQPIPEEVKAGDKIEVKGAVFEPYQIDRVTIAWERLNTEALASADESEEALPYFPPLDFVAYAGKSEKDWSTGVNMLKAAGIVACLAGGMFIPPVALGVPAISMMGNPDPTAEPKPASDIPVKGGMKVAGPLFNVKIGISNDSKPGLYYITVWATPPGASKAIPISRRTVIATSDKEKHENDKEEKKKSHD